MGLYRRLARSKRGMGTIFGGLFFVILILMGFNLMLWGFIQMDAYNSVVTTMQQRDQLAISENLIAVQPGIVPPTSSSSFNINVTNLGGTTVTIVAIYISNQSLSGALSSCTPCVVNPAPSNPYSFTNGNIAAGETNHLITVNGVNICGFGSNCQTSTSYKFILASSRGRLYTFTYPWRATNIIVVNNNGQFSTNIGPLTIFFDFNSFNFTGACVGCPTGTNSKPAWILPTGVSIILWIKVTNNAPFPVTLQQQSAINFARYSSSGNSGATTFFVIGSASQCTSTSCTDQAYASGAPIVFPAQTAQGPAPPTVVFFGATTQNGGTPNGTPSQTGPYLLSIGMFYLLQGGFQGENSPFVGADVCSFSNYQTSTPC